MARWSEWYAVHGGQTRRLLVTMLGFTIVAALLGAFKLRANTDRTYFEAVLAGGAIVAVMAGVVATAMIIWAMVEDRGPLDRPRGRRRD